MSTKLPHPCCCLGVKNAKRLLLLTLVAATLIVILLRGSRTTFNPISDSEVGASSGKKLGHEFERRTEEEQNARDSKICPSTAVIILLDAASMRASVSHQNLGHPDLGHHQDVVTQWLDRDATLAECREAAACHVYLVFYKDDVEFANNSFRDELVRRVNKTDRDSSGAIFVNVREVANRKEDARAINDIVLDAYLRNAVYFLLVSPTRLNFPPSNLRSVLPMALTLQQASPSKAGLILAEMPSVNVTTGYLVSRIHLDIFGHLVPHQISDLKTALGFLIRVYPEGLVRRFVAGRVAEGGGWNGTEWKRDVTWPPEVMTSENETLWRYLEAAANKTCLRCGLESSRRVISMSLYGLSPRYTMGALRNAQLLPVIFPGWRLWFYCEQPNAANSYKHGAPPPLILAKLRELGAEIRYIDPAATGLAPMLWRFTVAEEFDLEAFMIRDCDSRFSPREAAVVSEWMKTDKAFHCIRDHPSHSRYAVSGGLWGGRPARLKEIFKGGLKTVMRKYGAGYVADMHFLGKDVWPLVKNDHAVCHDSFSCEKYESSRPFPVKRGANFEHLGQVYDEHSVGRKGDIDILRSAKPNPKCSPD